MNRGLFTPLSIVSLILCAGAGAGYVLTMTPPWWYVASFPSGPPETIRWLGWSCAAFAVTTFALLLKRASQIRLIDDRLRCGRCLSCGYNLTGNLSGTCPECGGGGSMRAHEQASRAGLRLAPSARAIEAVPILHDPRGTRRSHHTGHGRARVPNASAGVIVQWPAVEIRVPGVTEA